MRFNHLYCFCVVIFASLLCNCYTVARYLNNFTMRGINAGSFIPKTVDSAAVPQAHLSANIQYSGTSRVRYNNGLHSPFDSNGNSIYDYSYAQSITASVTEYEGYNITWNTPRLYTSFSADFGPFAKVVSISTQTDIAIINHIGFYNLKVGPAVQLLKKRSGIRFDFVFSIGNFLYSADGIMSNGARYSNSYGEEEPKLMFGFSPYITINTLREYFYLRYFIQGGYQLNTPFFTKDDLYVRLSYALLSAGIFKNFSNYTMMTGVRFAYETKCNIFTTSEYHITRVNSTDIPIIPTLFLNFTFNLKFK